MLADEFGAAVAAAAEPAVGVGTWSSLTLGTTPLNGSIVGRTSASSGSDKVASMTTPDEFERASRAAADGDLVTLERILGDAPDVVKARDPEGHTLLGLACRAATGGIALPPVPGTPGQHAAVDRILAAGADPSAASNDGWAPLHTAATVGHVDLARRLLAAGANREGRLLGTRGGSALSVALFYGQRQVAEILADPPVPDNLRAAAALGRSIDRFVDGANLTPQSSEG